MAEVLITLGIIGIVAALTLPSIITRYQKKEAAVRLKQSYTILAQAIQMSELENGPLNQWELDTSISAPETTRIFVEKYLTPYIKTIKKVKLNTSSSPYDYYYIVNNQLVSGGGHTLYSIALANGTYLHFNGNYSISSKIGVRIDINGQKGPNIIGRDTFFANLYPEFYLTGKGLSRKALINACASGNRSDRKCCSSLIQQDGWQILPDYPW